MGAIPNGRPNRKKTYIIAVVLVVISLVVLSAFFYLLVGISPKNPHPPCVIEPIGLNLDRTTESSVNLVIVSAPEAATTDGAKISYTHNETYFPVTARLYNATGTVVANYTNGAFDNNLPLTKGMTLVVIPASGSVSTGDVITISSGPYTFSTTAVTVAPQQQQISVPLGLKQESKTSTSVSVIILSAPDSATTDGAKISYNISYNGTRFPVTAKLYDIEGNNVANYTNGSFDNNVILRTGMTLVVRPSGTTVHAGDMITISSSQNTFGVSTLGVS